MSILPPEAVESLPGPEWLRRLRAETLARCATLSWPTTEPEEWRYSRIGHFDPERWNLDQIPGGGSLATAEEVATRWLGTGEAAVLVSGAAIRVAGAPGVLIEDLSADGSAEVALEGADTSDLFRASHIAATAHPLRISVPAGAQVSAPVVVVHSADTTNGVTAPHIEVEVGADAECTLIEVHRVDVDHLVIPDTTVRVGAAARVRHLVLIDHGPRTWQVGRVRAVVERDATYRLFTAALGGDFARLRVDCELVGRGAAGNLSAVYFGDEEQMIDLRTFQSHVAPDTTSNLLFKGAVAGRSHAVYTGLIRIGADARGANAHQTNRILKLSEHAWAESVPNLEIENNDVRCSHASAVGPVDPDQSFYLESRGVPTDAAERLVVAGFFEEVVEQVSDTPILARLRALLSEKVSGFEPVGLTASQGAPV